MTVWMDRQRYKHHNTNSYTIDREVKKKFINVAIDENLKHENFSPKLVTRNKNCIR